MEIRQKKMAGKPGKKNHGTRLTHPIRGMNNSPVEIHHNDYMKVIPYAFGQFPQKYMDHRKYNYTSCTKPLIESHIINCKHFQ